MQANTTTSRKSSGCGCGDSVSDGRSRGGKSCSCGGKGCSVCEAPPEAYSRPQFFSGQLLTEDDLQSLADYTVAKNRLHNRMLFGDGVACGLRVNYDPCERDEKQRRHLIVRPGYAIDCCGDDIVVPCETRLDVVQLVRDLRTRMLGKDCGDPCRDKESEEEKEPKHNHAAAKAELAQVWDKAGELAGGPQAVDLTKYFDDRLPHIKEVVPTYCLYVVYCENPSDPVAPYDGEDVCGGGDCRHTRVREGYRFELRCGTPAGCLTQPNITAIRGVLASATGKASRINETISNFQREPTSPNRDRVLDAFDSILAEYSGARFAKAPELIAEARALRFDVIGRTRFNFIALLLLAGVLNGLDCEGLMPDCPPCDEDGVLIACFDFEDCTISNLCSQRRLPILSPAYFAQLGFRHRWQCLLMQACCEGLWTHTRKPGSIEHVTRSFREFEAASAKDPASEATATAAEQLNKEIRESRDSLIKTRFDRIDDPVTPEFQFTLLPELAREFAQRVGREEIEAEVQLGTLRSELQKLQEEVRVLKEVMPAKPKGGGKEKS